MSPPRRILLALGCALVAVAVFVVAGSGDESPVPDRGPVAPPGEGPNVVFILTDDQEVDSLRFMPQVQKLLVDQGTTFNRAYAGFPLCCPSRASFLTGQYAHNHGVISNRAPEGGYPALDSSETLPVWLQRAGYRTGYIGHYLNDYLQEDGVPPGWSFWFAQPDRMPSPTSRYFKPWVMMSDGSVKHYGLGNRDYSTDLFTRQATRFIRDNPAGTERPYFLSIGYAAPHVGQSLKVDGKRCNGRGPEPAPRHLGEFAGEEIPQNPATNEDDVSDKPAAIQDLKKVTGKKLDDKTEKYQCRLESLLAVDDAVEDIVDALDEAGTLEDTYIVFTTDNGFVQLEHRLKGGKSVPYENAIRIPFVVRGPGVEAGATSEEAVMNIDLAPTVLDMASGEAGVPIDGASMLRAFKDPDRQTGRTVLLESEAPPDPFTGVRTRRFAYAERETGELELYDMKVDPFQLENVAGAPAYADRQQTLADLLDRLRDCAGADCQTGSAR